MSTNLPANYRQSQIGFSLVEIMVGVAIGMIGIIVMMQVFAISEDRKQTTTASGEAQNNAVIALDQMQRDMSRSGYGFAQIRLLNCNLQLPNGSPIALAPVAINSASIPAGDPNTDTLLVSYGTSDDQPEGYNVTNQSGSTYTITGTSMLKVGDRAVISPAACGATTLVLDTVQTVAASLITMTNTVTGTALFNFGAAPAFIAYAIRSGNLTVCNFMTHNCGDATKTADTNFWRPIAENVVSLRAEYGRDTSGTMDGIADAWDQTAPTTSCLWARASAIRFVLVARSTKRENLEVTDSAPGWMSGATLVNLSLNPDGSANANWKKYRYKVFQTVVPIRNVAWMGAVSGC